MIRPGQVFLDANALIYALDETGEHFAGAVACIQGLLSGGVTLCTSHHVIEEVIHISNRINSTPAAAVVREIGKVPGLVLVEPDAVLDFAHRYASLSDRLHMGINDALLLQLMLDAGIGQLFSYDKKFVNKAQEVGIGSVI